MEYRINSLYLCVKDMKRAILFYEKLFEQQITEKDDIYSVFDINGFRLGLFANEKMNERHTWGDNCLPSIELKTIEQLQNKVAELQSLIVFPLTKIKSNWVLEIEDSEGNHVEMTAPVKQGEGKGRGRQTAW